MVCGLVYVVAVCSVLLWGRCARAGLTLCIACCLLAGCCVMLATCCWLCVGARVLCLVVVCSICLSRDDCIVIVCAWCALCVM